MGPGPPLLPKSAHRNPSITPDMGFRAYKSRQCSGTSELGYATGEINIQNCVMKTNVYRTSRYCTLSAASHSPTASAVMMANSTNNGTVTTAQVGVIP